MRSTSKGQVTIPQKIRKRFGLPDTAVEFVAKQNSVARPTRGQTIVRRLRGRSTVRMSTDEILALTRK